MSEELFRYNIIQKFNETEMMLYKYLMPHAGKIPCMTIWELAAGINVSTSTVLRFCNKINCGSYNDFKERFSKCITERDNIVLGFGIRQLLHYFQGAATGSVWIGNFAPNIIRKEFGLTDNLEPINILAIGYSDGEAADPERHSQTRNPTEEMVSCEKL